MAHKAVSFSFFFFFLIFSYARIVRGIQGRKLAQNHYANHNIHPFGNEEYEIIRHYASYQMHDAEKGYGTRANLSVWGNRVMGPHSGSSVSISLTSANGGYNVIQAGFIVHPDLYNNTDLRFFTFWTADNYAKTGCYDTACEGFKVVSPSGLKPGQAIYPVSEYNKHDRYVALSIRKDKVSGDWSLYREDQRGPTLLGFWPKSLFTSLAEKATTVSWDGIVFYPKNNAGPAMGSGHFASEGRAKAAYFKNIEVFDKDGNAYSPQPEEVVKSNERPDCYSVSPFKESMFYFGGPNGCRN